MSVIRKKIAMLGAFGVGKTSLVRRFVSNEFSEDYVSTLGVRIEKRSLEVSNQEVELLVWDIAGDDEFLRMRSSYLRGSSGILMVADATREWTTDKLVELKKEGDAYLSDIPWHVLVNKSDKPQAPGLEQKLRDHGFQNACRTSAKTGENVAEVFTTLTNEVIGI